MIQSALISNQFELVHMIFVKKEIFLIMSFLIIIPLL